MWDFRRFFGYQFGSFREFVGSFDLSLVLTMEPILTQILTHPNRLGRPVFLPIHVERRLTPLAAMSYWVELETNFQT